MGQYGLSAAGAPGGYPASMPYTGLPASAAPQRMNLSAAPPPIVSDSIAKPKKKGFFSKVGAVAKGLSFGTVKNVVKGIVTTPVNIVKRIAKNPLDIKAWAEAGLMVGCFVPGVNAFCIPAMAAYTAWSSFDPVMSGVKGVISGWKNNDLKMIEDGAAAAGTGVAGTALAVFGARSAVRGRFGAEAAGGHVPTSSGNGFKGMRQTTSDLKFGKQEMGAVKLIKNGVKDFKARGTEGLANKYPSVWEHWTNKAQRASNEKISMDMAKGKMPEITKSVVKENMGKEYYKANQSAMKEFNRTRGDLLQKTMPKTQAGQWLRANEAGLYTPALLTSAAITKTASRDIAGTVDPLVNPYADPMVDELIAMGIPPELANDPNFVAQLLAEQTGAAAGAGVSPAAADPFAALNGAGLSVGSSNPYGAGFTGFLQAAPTTAASNPFGAYGAQPVSIPNAGFTA